MVNCFQRALALVPKILNSYRKLKTISLFAAIHFRAPMGVKGSYMPVPGLDTETLGCCCSNSAVV